MKMIAFVALAVALVSPAVAGDNDKQQANPSTTKKPHTICKRESGSTGTHMAPLVCKTAEEWAAMNEEGTGKLGSLSRNQVQGSGDATTLSRANSRGQ